jgi:hypothetical protein
MSMINEELRRQQSKDIGEALKKVFGDKIETLPPNDPALVEERIAELNRRMSEELARGK